MRGASLLGIYFSARKTWVARCINSSGSAIKRNTNVRANVEDAVLG
jgi:hypothetical protein